MTVRDDREFSLTVERAVMVPELDALRELVVQLKAEFEADPALKEQFQADPAPFLGARGVNIDLQRELLTEFGFAGAEGGCFILSCIVSEGCLITEIPEILIFL